MSRKLNQLLNQWPTGAVGTAAWLESKGIYRQLVRRYVTSDWLQPLGHGAFIRSGATIDWFGGLYALQQQLGLRVHVAASTALSVKGLGHYLPLGNNTDVYLFSECRERLPSWFTRHSWGVRIQHHHPLLFKNSEAGYTDIQHGEYSVRASSPERAILEFLHLATTNEAIDHGVELVEGLATLRPQVLQDLLEQCRSVKVKRLFLWTAEHAGHDWFARLEPGRIDLGKGKRQLYLGGVFDKKYQITVPVKKELTDV